MSDVIIESRGAAGLITLNRPGALNAMTAAMVAGVAAAMPGFARNPETYAVVIRSGGGRAFCAGGDVREIIGEAKADKAAAAATMRREYEMNWLLECFSKPTLSLIDGMVVGSGVGLTHYGTHRIAAAGYKFAMPEVRIGLFPDVGISSVLARMPHHIGMYLGLTGRSIGRADAFALGLATHCIPADEFDDITAAIVDADPVDPVLDSRHEHPGPGGLSDKSEVIAKCFGAARVEDVVAQLKALRGPHEDWAQGVLADLAKAAPLSLKVTHRLIRSAATMDLRQALQMDDRLCARFLAGKDFHEGVRAALIDKDGKPAWSPPRIKDVTDAAVDAYFAPRGDADLTLPSRAAMQAARV